MNGVGKLDPEYRFAKSVREGVPSDIRPDLGPCLVFTGAKNGNGYGQFRFDGKNGYAHRYAWERVNGPVPPGLTVDHLCMNRCCVRIEHLEIVTGVENAKRGVMSRTHCRNGHALVAGNVVPGSLNACLICERATRQRGAAKRRKGTGGTPQDGRRRYDQRVVKAQIMSVRRAQATIAQAARIVGCNPNYLGRRVWRETKKAVLLRDSALCLRCGALANDVHHRIARGSGGSANPEISFGMANLTSLCRSCHDHIERHRDESYRLGWLIHRGDDTAEMIPLTYPDRYVWLYDDGSQKVIPRRRSA